MTGWILFTAVISLVIGIVFGWFFCIWALANHIARNGNGILKKGGKRWRAIEDKNLIELSLFG